jgi:hypothetical protein
MSLREYVAQELDRLNKAKLPQMADYLAFLKFPSRARKLLREDTALAALYAEFAEENLALVEVSLASLEQKTQRREEDIKTRQQAIKEQDERIDRLAEIVQRLAFELGHDRDMAGRDRENLPLRLEISLLRFERRLPPGKQAEEDSEETE